jgi:predicted nucleic acid-binding protein
MTAATFDANVLTSGFVRPHGPPGQLLQIWRAGAFMLIVSDPLIGEMERTLGKRYFADRLTRRQRANTIALLRGEAVAMP